MSWAFEKTECTNCGKEALEIIRMSQGEPSYEVCKYCGLKLTIEPIPTVTDITISQKLRDIDPESISDDDVFEIFLAEM